MLGFAWLLRSEAARVLHETLCDQNKFVTASHDVLSVAQQACKLDGCNLWVYPSPVGLVLLTRYTARTEGKP